MSKIWKYNDTCKILKTQFSKYNDACKILKTQFSQPDVINFQKRFLILHFWNIYYNFVFRNYAGPLIFRKIFLITQQFASADWEKKVDSKLLLPFMPMVEISNLSVRFHFLVIAALVYKKTYDKIIVIGQDFVQFLKYLKFMHEIARPFCRTFRNPWSIFFRVFSNLEHSVLAD